MRALLLTLLLMLAGCVEAHPTDFAPYTLRLDFENGVCSGTAVGPNIILTTQHCFDGAGRLAAINGEPAYALNLIKDGKDHALVRVSVTFKRWARVGPPPKTGDRLRYIGNPLGLGKLYREGVVSGAQDFAVCPFDFAPSCRLTLVDINATGGDSGAGYFDRAGRLVGAHTGTLKSKDLSWSIGVMVPMAFTAQDWKAIADV